MLSTDKKLKVIDSGIPFKKVGALTSFTRSLGTGPIPHVHEDHSCATMDQTRGDQAMIDRACKTPTGEWRRAISFRQSSTLKMIRATSFVSVWFIPLALLSSA